jgi:hypothetical protein
MAQQPIYGDNHEIIDYFDDGLPSEEASQETPEQEPVVQEPVATPPAEATQAAEATAPSTWTVPEMLKSANDLFVGTTVHHDDGDPQGPLISLFAREVPDGPVTVRTFRAAELSQHAFLDNLQKAIAVTMQAHFLVWAEKQRKRLEEEARRKARQPSATKPTPPVAQATVTPPVQRPATPTPTQKPATKPTPAQPAGEKKKYETVSLFD